jgi:hypothetical protein
MDYAHIKKSITQARTTTKRKVIEYYSEHARNDYRIAVASNPNISLDLLLSMLKKEGYGSVIAAIVRNDKVPLDILVKVAVKHRNTYFFYANDDYNIDECNFNVVTQAIFRNKNCDVKKMKELIFALKFLDDKSL